MSDLDELTSLNRDYVASVQNCDVKRFDEILSPDFYCSNPDKSLVDRAGFLRQTAVPVTIKNLQAHDIKIRIMGDFAIIHASTSYTMPDGKPAAGAIPTAGRGKMDAGLRCRHMCRGDAANKCRRPREGGDP
jgi:ketosteroid isomerase-like protein